jgi:hypothetical protein
MNKRYRETRRQYAFPYAPSETDVSSTPEALASPRRRKTPLERDEAPPVAVRIYSLLLQAAQRITNQFFKVNRKRKLQLLEIQQLGEKRFVGIVRVGRQKFLIGGAATSVSLLAEIHAQGATVIAPRPLDQERA